MRILLVNKFIFPKGGAETYTFDVGKMLEEHGHEVQYFGLENEKNIVGNRVGSYVTNMDFSQGIKANLNAPFRIIYSREARKKIRAVLDDFQPDVVHLNNIQYHLTPSIILEINKWRKETKKECKIVYTTHDYQLVCPSHGMFDVNMKPCERCLDGHYIHCLQTKCLKNSRAKSLLGTLDGYMWKYSKAYSYVDAYICCSFFLKSKLDTQKRFRDKTIGLHAQIITVALTTFIVRYITLNYHKNKIEEANSYYSSSILACFQLSGALLIFALLCIFKLEDLLKIPEKLIPSVKALFIFVFINFVLTTIVTPLNASCFIKNRLDLNGIVKIISYIAESVVLVVVFRYCTADIWVVGFGSFIAAIVSVGGNYILKQKLTPELKFRKKLVSYKRVKEMMSNGVWQSVNSLGNTLNSGLDLLISNLMLTAVQTGQIAVVKTIGTMFSMLYQVVSQPFQPRMLKMYSTGNKEQFFNELTKAMRICGYFSNVAFAGFVVLGWTYE